MVGSRPTSGYAHIWHVAHLAIYFSHRQVAQYVNSRPFPLLPLVYNLMPIIMWHLCDLGLSRRRRCEQVRGASPPEDNGLFGLARCTNGAT